LHPFKSFAARGERSMVMKLEEWRRRGQWFEHRGHPIFYVDEQRGPGPTLLLIHGFPTSSWDWTDLWPLIAPRFGRLIAVDMIGFGYSAKPADYDYDLVDQATLHETLLSRLGVRKTHLLVHDYGVSVAQELLARHRQRREPRSLELQSVTLLNGGLFPETHRARLIQKLLLGPLGPLISLLNNEKRFTRSLGAVFGPATPLTPEHASGFWRLSTENGGHRLAHRLIRYMLDRRRNRERWVTALQETRVPLRAINGPEDPVSGAHMVTRYRELVPRPDVVSLPGIGHYPQVEAPQGVADAFLPFIDRVEGLDSAA